MTDNVHVKTEICLCILFVKFMKLCTHLFLFYKSQLLNLSIIQLHFHLHSHPPLNMSLHIHNTCAHSTNHHNGKEEELCCISEVLQLLQSSCHYMQAFCTTVANAAGSVLTEPNWWSVKVLQKSVWCNNVSEWCDATKHDKT